MTLSVVTLNILDDLLHWRQRGPLIVTELADLRPGVIALQEVSLPDAMGAEALEGAASSAHWLAERLGGYQVLLAPGAGHAASDSLAILTSLEVAEQETIVFPAQQRQALRAVLQQGTERWQFVTTHLYWNPVNETPRIDQAAQLVEWVPRDAPGVVCGDFNAAPHSRTLRTFEQRFQSAHRLLHGDEPLLTYPTMLRRGPGLRHRSRHAVLRAHGLLRLGRNVRYGGTVDYVLVDREVGVREARVLFAHPSADDPRIFASDHFGLYAVLEQSAGT
jgi:endonuclease/exonuclease/phosphatase family metal-dependent hydrolase